MQCDNSKNNVVQIQGKAAWMICYELSHRLESNDKLTNVKLPSFSLKLDLIASSYWA